MSEFTDERLREIIENTYCCLDEGGLLAAELLAARAEVERLLRLMPPTARGITNGPGEGSWSVFAEKVVKERDAARDKIKYLENVLQSIGASSHEILEAIRRELNRKI